MTNSWARSALLRTLGGLTHGSLEIVDGASTHRFGDPASDLRACIAVHNERFYSRAVLGGEDGAGDSYVDGDWSSPDLVAVIRVAVRNLSALGQGNFFVTLASRLANRVRHMRRDNSVEGSRRNIHEHYDLSNDFFRLFLDRNMLYSSAVFDSEATSLDDAQIEKIDRLCRKLDLQPGEEVLEIGTGWGAFALHAASRYGCRVTTTTISQQQHDYSRERFDQAGEVGRRIQLLFEDYRNLKGGFDRIVSIEMFEAVGFGHYDDFFGACDRLLTHDGQLAMQTITMNEQNFNAYRKGSDWIQRRIFPGAELSSVREILASLSRVTRMGLVQLEDIGIHYALTLAEWRRRVHAEIDAIRGLGFDDAFLRTWDYYLAYCEGAFRERYIGNVQIVMTKLAAQRRLVGEPVPAARSVTAL